MPPAAGEFPAPRPPQAFLVRGLATDAFCWAPETRVIQELPEPTGGYVASSVAELPLFCAVPVRASAEAGVLLLDTPARTARFGAPNVDKMLYKPQTQFWV